MIVSSLRTSGPLVLALAVSAVLTGCGGGPASSAPSAAGPSSAASAVTTGGPASSASAPAVVAPSSSGGAGGAVSPGVAPTSPAATPSAPAARPVSTGDCPSLALVRTTLGVQVGAPAANGGAAGVVVCSYPKGSNPSAVVVRIQEGQTTAGFAAAKAGFAKSGQKTVDVPDMFDGAYRSQLGSSTYGVTRTLVVLRGSTEILVTAQTSFEGLTRLTHTMLD